MKSYTVIGMLTTLMSLTAFCGGISISNIQASQRSKDTGSVDITFDLSADSNKVSVILSAMNTDNNQKVRMNAIYDEAGNFLGNPAKVEPGNGRHLVWNSALDLGKGFYSSAMVVTVRATEYDLPLSRIQQYISDKETESQLLQEARTNAPIALAQAAQALNVAKQGVVDAEAAVEAVKYENLLAAKNAADGLVTTNTAAANKAQTAYNATNVIYVAATNTYAAKLNAETNIAWTIVYTNASVQEARLSGNGCTKLALAIDDLKYFTLVKITYKYPAWPGVPPMVGKLPSTTWADATQYIADLRKATTDAKAVADAKETDLATAKAALDAANDAKDKAITAATVADNNLKNVTYLQVEAQKALEKAEAAEAATQKAYDDAKKTCEELGL